MGLKLKAKEHKRALFSTPEKLLEKWRDMRSGARRGSASGGRYGPARSTQQLSSVLPVLITIVTHDALLVHAAPGKQ
jgi:hypothetical protein